MKNRGVILVLLLIAAGLTAASTALWHQYQQTRRALDFWGPDAAYLIGHAPSVELTALRQQGPAAKGSDEMDANRPTVDISQARGLVHFRRSLLENENFDWDAKPSDAAAGWDYRVRFSDDHENVSLVFDIDQQVIAVDRPAGDQVALTERMAQGVEHFLSETLAKAAK